MSFLDDPNLDPEDETPWVEVVAGALLAIALLVAGFVGEYYRP